MGKMKSILSITVCLLGMLTSCTNESAIHAELEDALYDFTDNPADPIQHERYLLFSKYKTYLITNPVTRDYKFNFQKKNNLRITPVKQDTELLKRAIERLHTMFLDVYSEEFKQKHLPFSIILADSILFLGMENKTPSYHAYAANRFVAMAGVRPTMGLESDSLKQAIKGDLHSRYWIDYLGGEAKVFTIPDSLDDISKAYFAKDVGDLTKTPLGNVVGKLPWQIDFHPLGFVSYNPATTFFDPDPDRGGWWIETPNADTDRRQWIAFIFTTPKAERERIINSYPLMKRKYEILKKAFMACDNFDIDQLP